MNRHVAVPLEGRAVLAYRDHRLDELVVYTSTQVPHIIRLGLSEVLGLEERNIRVIAPDVGGGFGSKARLSPEEAAIAALALELDHPVRWVEDRGEHFLASTHTRDHHYRVTAYADARGRVAGHRRRADRRRRRLCDVAERTVPGNRDGRAQPSGAVQHPQLPCEDLHRRHQQVSDRSLSRRRTAGRLLCDRAHDRRGGACGRTRPARGAHGEHGHLRADALHHDRQSQVRQRRLSRRGQALRRGDRSCRQFARGSSRASPTAG